MFQRYLTVFEKVLVAARVARSTPSIVDEANRVDHEDIKVLPLPYYIGPYQYLLRKNKLGKILRDYIDSYLDDAFICRVPGVIGTAAARYLVYKKKPYGVEVVGDPMDVFARGSFDHPLRTFFRYSTAKDLKGVVKNAAAAIYVTKKYLQTRYPPHENAYSTYASNVMLPREAFAAHSKKLKYKQTFSLVAIGSLDAMYKSPDVAIKAIALLTKKDINVSLQWLGGGRYIEEMKALASRSGVADRVNFIGTVASPVEVRQYLDAADLFVLPSRTEGLPRVFVEAMARGLPCIGTRIGGIPELLEENALVPINQPAILANKIADFLTKSSLADAHAERNLKEARNYAFDLLDVRRINFYQHLKSVS
jgi:glycosyltransferase involved in cell wall biosynthesis